MLWFFPTPPDPSGAARFDAVLAQNLKAQQRSAVAAEKTTRAAEEHREHVEAVVGAFKDRTDERLRTRNQTLEQLLARDL